MTDTAHTLWLQTLMALAGLGFGLILHLKWHPLRDLLSEAWDMLQSFVWLVPVMATLHLLSGPSAPWFISDVEAVNSDATGWRQMLQMLPAAAQEMAGLAHGFFPPWPVALALPVVLSLLTWRVKRFPFRYDSRSKRPGIMWALITVVLLAWGWLCLECFAWVKPIPAWVETLRMIFRWMAKAWMMAALQIYMVRLVMGWKEPVEPNDQKDLWLALEHTLSRWHGIMMLSVLDLLWLLGWNAVDGSHHLLSGWLLVEASMLFACLPVVIAWARGSLSAMVELMSRVFMRTLLPLIGFAITATVLLLLVHFSMHNLLSLVPETSFGTGLIRILIALVLATVRSWLFLALVLTLLRHGCKAVAPQGRGN